MKRPTFNRILIATAFTAAALTAPACGDDPVTPGSLTVAWTHGSFPTCGSRLVTRIEARAMQKGLEVASASAGCADAQKSGTVTIPELTPGTYDVEIEGQNENGKGIYSAKVDKQKVRDSKETVTEVLLLEEKPARLRVDWLPPGGKCATTSIATVDVSLTYNATTSQNLEGEAKVSCENTFPSPSDPATLLPGVLFTDLKPNPDVVIFVYGKNAAGVNIAQGQAPARAISSGDDDAVVINLTTCPGSPPVCD